MQANGQTLLHPGHPRGLCGIGNGVGQLTRAYINIFIVLEGGAASAHKMVVEAPTVNADGGEGYGVLTSG